MDTKIGKGSRIIDTVKELMKDSSTWLHISTKQEYQFPDNPHFMWSDIQISKGKVNIDRLKLMEKKRICGIVWPHVVG